MARHIDGVKVGVEYDLNEHFEFVVEYKDGTRDWIDPVLRVEETADMIFVTNSYLGENTYTFYREMIADWTVRLYNKSTTYDRITKG